MKTEGWGPPAGLGIFHPLVRIVGRPAAAGPRVPRRLGRFVLVLPFVGQERFSLEAANYLIGVPLFLIGLVFGLVPVFSIQPLNVAEKGMELTTTGFYKYTRNPIYLGELLWCLGWSITHGSIIGIALAPVWWAGLSFLIMIEEESLSRALGEEYAAYKKKVKGRIIPGLPI